MKDAKWKGEPLSQEDLDKGNVTFTKWRPNAKYSWAAGEAISRFLEELKNGRMIATKCKECNRILFPPRISAFRFLASFSGPHGSLLHSALAKITLIPTTGPLIEA